MDFQILVTFHLFNFGLLQHQTIHSTNHLGVGQYTSLCISSQEKGTGVLKVALNEPNPLKRVGILSHWPIAPVNLAEIFKRSLVYQS